MGEFSFPTNIKQIGSIGDGIRIYIEDYAYSYLQQFAEAGGYEERLAFLVGRVLVIDGQAVLFISGLVQGRYTAMHKDAICFTDKSWRHAKDEIKQYFSGLDIVGWVQSQPGYGAQISESSGDLHKKFFPKEDRVLFVLDPIEKVDAFYSYDERADRLIESQGYFIYYDKNRGMHEYMLDNRIAKGKMRPLPEVDEAAAPIVEETTEKQAAYSGTRLLSKWREQGVPFSGYSVKRDVAAQQQKRVSGLLVTLSAALFIVCFIMGVGLIQNEGRITMMEEQLVQLSTAYRDLVLQAHASAAPVFAEQEHAAAQEPPLSAQIVPANEQAILVIEDGGELLAESQEVVTAEVPQPEVYVASAAAPEPMPIPLTYTVQAGDSLTAISLRFYGNTDMVREIMRLNELDDPDRIFFGKVLRLP